MKRSVYRYVMLWLVLCGGIRTASATHLRAAELQVERLNCNDLTFQITLVVYTDTKSNTLVGGLSLNDGNINFGDGSAYIIPYSPATPRPDLGTDVGIVTVTVVHTYAAPGIYKINYFEGDRSAGVLNMTNSDDTAYSSSITINTTTQAGCNHFPVLTIPPVDKGCPGRTFFHIAGAVDEDGDSISYALAIPEKNIDVPVDGYVSIDDPAFYINYTTSNEAGNGPPSFGINPVTGLITWDAPGLQGQYNIAFAIIEWRRDPFTDELIKLSTTIRDMQIIVEECANLRPNLQIPDDICIEAGQVLNATIMGLDPEKDSVKIEPFSEVFTLSTNPAAMNPLVPKYRYPNPKISVQFNWQTDCAHIREQPYQVVFKITDKPSSGVALTTFKTWNIRVIAPAPKGEDVSVDNITRRATITWDTYECANASAIQIWRSVDSNNYVPGDCNTGLPTFLGYELVASVDPADQLFIDSNNGAGLAVGALYCYRIIAVFSLPAGGKSKTSGEVCIGPIEADAAIITHVTVAKTDPKDGQMRVSWRSPIVINTVEYPRPYYYEVYRAEGLSGNSGYIKVMDRSADTTHVDTGLNTTFLPYHYRVVIFSKLPNATEFQPFDTSSVASSVWLGAAPGNLEITLNWSANVPWSNTVQNSPWHRIYRSVGTGTELILIDSVDVQENGFTYTDKGNFMNEALDENTLYCYRIMTRGSYGNSIIGILENFSQEFCAYPVNSLLPCKPSLSVALTDCDQFLQDDACDTDDFSNQLSWEPDISDGCRADIISYNVYAGDVVSGTYSLLASGVSQIEFEEQGLTSYARCYRIEAVDALGNVSPLSDPVCNDNCPYYELPNVMTPNGDGCNDRFSAYRPEDEATCSSENISRCPQFVEKVSLKVFNRWGKAVYRFESGNGRSINIDWDGRDSDGSLLDAAVYYYQAEVMFKTVDPAKSKREIRGWVQLIR